MWKESNRNIVVIFQPNILRIVGFYVRHSAIESLIGIHEFLFGGVEAKLKFQIKSIP